MASPLEFHYRWSWLLPADAEALWPLVSDTHRFNRDAGLPPVEDARAPGEEVEVGRRKLRIRVKGVLLEWEELPFEWFRPWRFGVVRRYSRGPLREMRVLAHLEAVDGAHTRLTYQVSARPRGLLGLVTTPLQIGIFSRILFGRTFKRYAASCSGPGSVTGLPRARPALASDLRRRLDAAGVGADLAMLLSSHVSGADELTLGRIRPYELAELWGRTRRETLVACLKATRAGVLDLSWDILCPSCRGVNTKADTLRNLHLGQAHCDSCRIDFSPAFDQSVELTFHPNPAVRRVEASLFCVAGPQLTPHIESQQLLAPGETRVVRPILSEGRHRVAAVGVPGGPSFLVEGDGPRDVSLEFGPAGWEAVPLTVAPDATLRLINRGQGESLFRIERTAWGDLAATAAEVTALSEFRDLFSSEVLAEGTFAGVGSLAVLFTDLRGSTAMYAAVGDAPAFGRVMRHFQLLERAVVERRGSVVKTIGDAVMAVFPSMADAVDAALEAQAALARPGNGTSPLTLKAGVHFGPAIAVTLNDRLDYFGTTVNIAARLGGLSTGEDVVLSDRVRADPQVREVLSARGVSEASLLSGIRGLQDDLLLWRVSAP